MIVASNAPDSIASCADAIRAGALIGLPTETVYGLGADASSDEAVAKIFAAKGRPADHPLIVHVAALDGGMSGVAHYAQQVPAFAKQLMAAFWPGPLTLILPRRTGVGAAAAGGQDSIGLRCPAHPAAQAVLAALRHPAQGQTEVWGIAAPSANRFGRVSPTTAAHVQSEMGHELLILDGGPCTLGIESTIIDCTRGAPVLLRPGSITSADVEAACGRRLLSKEEQEAQSSQAPRASGTLESHYAPNARVRLMDAKALQTAIDMLPASAPDARGPTIAVYARAPLKVVTGIVTQRTMPNDAAPAAHELFSVLRELDALGVQLIWVETPPDGLAWDGVRDRLQRAAA
ncbi:L-threonylcarbamoyladenylate synthase [Rhodoferax aquaticus]|uniref:Threonylcarbamoyl-AMP synthase n=1 Tax=Rhodoferax aquaticus TaxID=2527691 RepID=A0A515EJQ1_9BURK|nr:L-threonylcarbamoyladenylate synthase [Rhodoferax aquaticus]QDL52891.1 threonylcarbamoyl-AMP synthase [Rhodoferax aquaticus]